MMIKYSTSDFSLIVGIALPFNAGGGGGGGGGGAGAAGSAAAPAAAVASTFMVMGLL